MSLLLLLCSWFSWCCGLLRQKSIAIALAQRNAESDFKVRGAINEKLIYEIAGQRAAGCGVSPLKVQYHTREVVVYGHRQIQKKILQKTPTLKNRVHKAANIKEVQFRLKCRKVPAQWILAKSATATLPRRWSGRISGVEFDDIR